ncbi:MAG TPA: tetratricopeptide repeat protein, partial [Thermoanaerobaculia bacterium]|nr:tetratricopeptide repeat protein [Thermoanaerobaculia bacterium]
MEDSHLSVDELALWLSGRMEHEQMLKTVAAHLLARCPSCRESVQEIRRLQEEAGHWDEVVAVSESREAPDLFARLDGLSYPEQVRCVEEDEDLHSWGFCRFLLTRSRDLVLDDPTRAVDLANLAVRVSFHLDDSYDPYWVLDLRAKSYAYLGNARRVLGELRSAEDAFLKAEECLAKSMTGIPRVEAEILHLKASHRRAQRQLDDALVLADRALALYREAGDRQGIVATLLKKSKILEELGEFDRAIDLLSQAPAEIEVDLHPRLLQVARHNLLTCLASAGRFEEAEALLPEVRALAERLAQPLDLVRLRWTEGRVALGRGRAAEAEVAFREVQQEFLDRRMGYDAALVSLDLAVLYAQEGKRRELKRLAVDVM